MFVYVLSILCLCLFVYVFLSRSSLKGVIKLSERDVVVLLEVNRGDSIHQDFEGSQRKSFKSAKVFSALSWSWSSKSLQSSRDAIESHDTNEPCKPGTHCITLEKINAEEEKLYKKLRRKRSPN